jgi:N-acetylmuramoyl-L-alanine amidase
MKNVIKIAALVLVSISLAFTGIDKKVVVLDVGHGGKDTGAMIDGVNEKDINLAIAQKIKELNTNSQVEIILTRTTDEFISLDERAKKINDAKPDYVISLHTNSSKDEHQSGTEIYYTLKSMHAEKSKQLAIDISAGFTEGEVSIKHADFYLLKKVNSPMLLVELGYLSNPIEKAALVDKASQLAFAQSILKLMDQG